MKPIWNLEFVKKQLEADMSPGEIRRQAGDELSAECLDFLSDYEEVELDLEMIPLEEVFNQITPPTKRSPYGFLLAAAIFTVIFGLWLLTRYGPTNHSKDIAKEIHSPKSPEAIAAQAAKDRARILRKEGTAEGNRNALEQYLLAADLFEKSGTPLEQAYCLNVAGLIYRDLGVLDEAGLTLQKALELRRKHNGGWLIASTLINLGLVHQSKGELNQALELYEEAASIAHQENRPKMVALAENNLGAIAEQRDDPQRALDHYYRAASILEADKKSHYPNLAKTLNNIGVVYNYLGESRRALDFLHKANSIWLENGDQGNQALTWNNIGFSHGILGSESEEIDAYQKALKAAEAVENEERLALTYNNLGQFYLKRKDAANAQTYFQQAYELRRARGNKRGQGYTLLNLGATSVLMDDDKQAGIYWQQAEGIAKELEDINLQVLILNERSRREEANDQLAVAQSLLEKAVSLIEGRRSQARSYDLRASYLAARYDSYELLVDVLTRRGIQNPDSGFQEQAFNVNERSRARSLLDVVADVNSTYWSGPSPELLRQQADLLSELNRKKGYLVRLENSADSDSQKISDTQNETEKLQDEYLELTETIRKASLRMARQQKVEPMTLKEIQEKLVENDLVLLQFALDDDLSKLWVITDSQVKQLTLPGREEITSQVRQAYQVLSTEAEANTQIQKLLGETLLGPAADILRKKQRWIISADGALQYLPFDALIPPWSPNELVIDHHQVINQPSFSVIASLRELRKPLQHEKTIALFADPLFSSEPIALSTPQETDLTSLLTRSSDNKESWARLPGTALEARSIEKLLPEAQIALFMGERATLKNLREEDLRQYKVLHFSTHGNIDTDRPERSALVFSLVNAEGQPIEGYLRLPEIYDLETNADLVVLSACRTALGYEIRGEGLDGMTRAFMHAGTPRVIAGLWNIGDQVTADLMTQFYRNYLLDGLSAADALNKAKRRIRKDYPPRYWAAFVFHGDWR